MVIFQLAVGLRTTVLKWQSRLSQQLKCAFGWQRVLTLFGKQFEFCYSERFLLISTVKAYCWFVVFFVVKVKHTFLERQNSRLWRCPKDFVVLNGLKKRKGRRTKSKINRTPKSKGWHRASATMKFDCLHSCSTKYCLYF